MAPYTPLVVVVGTGLSGTGYFARLLTEMGHTCAHEGAIVDLTIRDGTWFGRLLDLGRDASWMAAPVLGRLPQGAVVVHQTRNPVAFVRSAMGVRLFADASLALGRYAAFGLDAVGGRALPEIERCMHFWTAWNALIAASATPLRPAPFAIERLDAAEATRLVRAIRAPVGRGPAAPAAALARVPRNHNTKARDASVRWATLPAGPTKDALAAEAARYGYTPAALERA